MAFIAWEYDEGFRADTFRYGEEEPDWRRIVEIPDAIWAEYKALEERLRAIQRAIVNGVDVSGEALAQWGANIARDPVDYAERFGIDA